MRFCIPLALVLALGGASHAFSQEGGACGPEPVVVGSTPEGLSVVRGAPPPGATVGSPLRLMLSAPARVLPAAPARLSLTLENVGTEPLRVAQGGGPRPPELHVYLQPLDDEATEGLLLEEGTALEEPARALSCGVGEPEGVQVVSLAPGARRADAITVDVRIRRPGRYRAWVVYRRCRGALLRGSVASDAVELEVGGVPRTPTAGLVLGDTHVEGALSSAAARAPVERALGLLAACFVLGEESGHMEAEWHVGEAGGVTGVRVVQSDIESEMVRGCVLRQLRHLTYTGARDARVRQVMLVRGHDRDSADR